jgi:hypothetical protein
METGDAVAGVRRTSERAEVTGHDVKFDDKLLIIAV